MTATSDTFPREVAPAAAPMAKTQPFFWSVQRELWENVAIYRAPLIAAAVVLFGAVLGHVTSHQIIFQPRSDHPMAVPAIISYIVAAVAILFTGAIVGAFYCLAALNAERRDRSVLFWKSLPVSDLTTVLSKAVVPALILPVITFVTIIGTHLVMLVMDVAATAVKGDSISLFLSGLPLGQLWLDLAYGFLLLGLWWAPLWGWLLLASAWSKRMTFLWGVAPPLAICLVERMAFGTDYAWKLLKQRLLGGIGAGFSMPPGPMHHLELPWPDPLPFLAKPGLWIGLVLAGGFVAGAVWLRRCQEPV